MLAFVLLTQPGNNSLYAEIENDKSWNSMVVNEDSSSQLSLTLGY